MENIIITPVICKVIEIIGAISGGLLAAIFFKNSKRKFYDNHGCKSGCIIKFETFCNKTSELIRDLSKNIYDNLNL